MWQHEWGSGRALAGHVHCSWLCAQHQLRKLSELHACRRLQPRAHSPDVTDPAVDEAGGVRRQRQRRAHRTAVVVAAHNHGLHLGAGYRRIFILCHSITAMGASEPGAARDALRGGGRALQALRLLAHGCTGQTDAARIEQHNDIVSDGRLVHSCTCCNHHATFYRVPPQPPP